MATIKVNMPICDKTHVVTVTQRDDGDLDVHIDSNCAKVAEYGLDLRTLSFTDLGCITESRIMDPAIVEHLTPTCLAPVAVFNAAWLEAGLMSKSLARDVQRLSMEFMDG